MGASQAVNPPQRVLIDTNIALDFLLRREPWLTEAAGLLSAHAEGRVIGYVPASALTDIFYISRRAANIQKAYEVIDLCLVAFEVIGVDRAIIDAARNLPGSDFEDNVQIACAITTQLDAIITRDEAGFAHAPVPTMTPKTFAERMK